eukprot:2264927-Rhodomonas_salina.2
MKNLLFPAYAIFNAGMAPHLRMPRVLTSGFWVRGSGFWVPGSLGFLLGRCAVLALGLWRIPEQMSCLCFLTSSIQNDRRACASASRTSSAACASASQGADARSRTRRTVPSSSRSSSLRSGPRGGRARGREERRRRRMGVEGRKRIEGCGGGRGVQLFCGGRVESSRGKGGRAARHTHSMAMHGHTLSGSRRCVCVCLMVCVRVTWGAALRREDD